MGINLTRLTIGRKRIAATESSDDESIHNIDVRKLRPGSIISKSENTIVYEGSYKDEPVAIKVIQKERGTNVSPERKEKFEREVRFLAKVKHDNIVKFIGATMDPALTIVTEIMKGGSLQKHLLHIRPFSIDLTDATLIALDISRAMEYLHSKNIIHCNLRPSSIFLAESKRSAKLGGFRLCREGLELEGDDLCAEVGSYQWMAPEVYIREEHELGPLKVKCNHKVDVYSFSILVWELITNETPFMGMDNQMIEKAVADGERPNLEQIPGDLQNLLQSCWTKNPEQRPEFEHISTTLEHILSVISPGWDMIEEMSATEKDKLERRTLLGKIKRIPRCVCDYFENWMARRRMTRLANSIRTPPRSP